MLISHKHKFIFIHIPKTGGTSVRNTLNPFCNTVKDLNDSETNKTKTKHIKARELKKLLPKETWNKYFKFAFVRNPWDRITSIYKFNIEHQQPGYKDYKEKDFASFLEMIYQGKKVHISEPQKDYVCDEKGNLIVDFVGHFENLDKDFKYICKKLGIRKKLKLLNPSNHEYYKKMYNKTTKKMVNSLFKEDIEFFNYNFNQTNATQWFFRRTIPKATMKIALRTRLKNMLKK
ncbi:MAG: sulfotransferase family 2 domain-containing protein [Candidatus Woesearchaeota archaeon]